MRDRADDAIHIGVDLETLSKGTWALYRSERHQEGVPSLSPDLKLKVSEVNKLLELAESKLTLGITV